MSNKGTANQNKRPTFEMKKKKKFISGWKLSLFALLCLFVFYALHPFIFGTPQDEYGYENDEPEIAYEEEIIEQEQIPIKEQVEEPLTQISASERVITKEDDIAYLIGALNAEYENEAEEENKENSTDSIHDEHSYKLYEEELPDNIIDEEQTDEPSSTVHYQQKNIQSKQQHVGKTHIPADARHIREAHCQRGETNSHRGKQSGEIIPQLSRAAVDVAAPRYAYAPAKQPVRKHGEGEDVLCGEHAADKFPRVCFRIGKRNAALGKILHAFRDFKLPASGIMKIFAEHS